MMEKMIVKLTDDDIKKVIDFLNRPDYDFFRGMRDEMSEDEFRKFCREFPGVEMVL